MVAQYALKTKDGTSRDRYLEEKAKDALISHLAWRGLGIVDRSRILRRQAQHLLPHPGRQQDRQRHQGLHPRRGPRLHQAEHRRRAVRRGYLQAQALAEAGQQLHALGSTGKEPGTAHISLGARTERQRNDAQILSNQAAPRCPAGLGGAGPQVARARRGGNPRTPRAAWPAPACRDARHLPPDPRPAPGRHGRARAGAARQGERAVRPPAGPRAALAGTCPDRAAVIG